MLTRNSDFRAIGPGAGHKKFRHNVSRILARRERLVAELERLDDQGETSKFVENARQLLTRWWSTAEWNAREQLLDTADWLVRLEKRRSSQPLRSA